MGVNCLIIKDSRIDTQVYHYRTRSLVFKLMGEKVWQTPTDVLSNSNIQRVTTAYVKCISCKCQLTYANRPVFFFSTHISIPLFCAA